MSDAAVGEPFVRILADLAVAAPDTPAVTCGAESVTRAELERRATALAHAYRRLGVREGDLVTIGLPNSVEFFTAMIAVWKLGATPQPVSWRLPLAERRAIVGLADSSLVVGVDPAEHPDRVCVPAGFEPTVQDVAAGPLPLVVSPAWKAPTSGGSTGRPKIIVAPSPAAITGTAAGEVMGMQAGDVQLVAGPLYHNAPLMFSSYGLLLGHHLVVQPKFDAAEALELIGKYKVTWLQVVPTMMSRMLREIRQHPGGFKLSTIRVLWHMAAPCPEWLKQSWIDLLGPQTIWELYAGTEAIGGTIITGKEWLAHRGSVGKPALGELTILDDEGNPLPAGEVGEIFMRPWEGMPKPYKYLGAEIKRVGTWESIGDLGWLDEDGYLYMSDRRTDLIVTGGANVFPAEVESIINGYPGVVDSVVVGLPDDDLGQAVHAVVHTESNVIEEQLRDYLLDQVVRYKVPRTMEFVAEPLREDSGKVRRSLIREQAIARRNATG
ncbi:MULTISPECIES: AMP-binding protein [unclassified Mycobacteroides]|uniref:AMP-binding protein n=1 Tax=unclassified Mycobacteroides TaxID=2618759 RepID=UPI0012DC244C|nr:MULTISPECIES: AMP-binding protein [unclassified Mycobacteroides]MUM17770.1 acid--CoA ligase [Mycobacteroides sp. CBMA 326]